MNLHGAETLSAAAKRKLAPLARENRPARPTIVAVGGHSASGPSGTGKTLAAEVIAHLGKPVLRPEKFAVETEKYLDSLFARAESTGSVLLFDEADALFGKRSSIDSAHGRYSNEDVKFLLEAMGVRGIIAVLTGLRVAKPSPAAAARCRWIDIP